MRQLPYFLRGMVPTGRYIAKRNSMDTDVIGSSRFLVKTEQKISGAEADELQRRLAQWLAGDDTSALVLGHGSHAFAYHDNPPRWTHICCRADPKRVTT